MSAIDRCLKLLSNYKQTTGFHVGHLAVPASEWLLLQHEFASDPRNSMPAAELKRLFIQTPDGPCEILKYPDKRADLETGSIEALHEFCGKHSLDWCVSHNNCDGSFDVGVRGTGKGEEFSRQDTGLAFGVDVVMEDARKFWSTPK